ncbi:MAG: DUF4093 domain-containing protein [Oscillospiraceae bacterium]|nr:DUF4093 domain-containing protein [Oscillospiraceae bacterium]
MLKKLEIKQAVIVEGKCDRVILENVLSPETAIVHVNGFRVYKDKAKLQLIRRYAQSVGVILLTDSDNAGRQIRNHIANYLKSHALENKFHHVYVPNLLEVEDTSIAELHRRLEQFNNCQLSIVNCQLSSQLTRQCLFDAGLIGGAGSANKRRELLRYLSLPENLSVNALLDALNKCELREEYNKWFSQA